MRVARRLSDHGERHTSLVFDRYPFDLKNFIKISRMASGREIGRC